ncbi:hypothetical protein CHO01_19320 [Cellulomonas hominis]|uniref:Uncharacterized protein n=1 Tax=Cellulomonas hominis TaxID=156981 RepID=A0A511FC21_9CELL|nr:hypothetical protein [Cellulomonas hominis]MBB5472595.1 hypothetical protein [Cellulomonas hominis]NKY06647.1 hypothetical protein [Cellulomonas hominis]GEL46816.1 hypothetical protein CHO01_19320 [Cellulomonas hominis]
MVAVAILALLITAGGSAHAAPTSDPVEQTAELIEAIAPRSSPLEVGSEADGAIHFITETAVTTIPLSPELPVTIEDADGLVAPFGIDLPAEVNVTSAQTATDGTVVFPAVGRGVDVAVQTTTAGDVRLQTVIADPEAPHTFTYDFSDGIAPKLRDDGSALLVSDDDGEVVMSRGEVAPPWAVDAAGRDVDTSYTVEGSKLIQMVRPGPGATYPIVADPTVTVGTGIYVYFSQQETKSIAASPITDRAHYVGILCGAIPNGPAAAACMAITGDTIKSIANTFKSAAKNKQRVELKFLVVPMPPHATPMLTLVGWKPVA